MSIKTKFFVGAFVAAFAFAAASANAAYVHTVTLKQGSSGSQVMMLQQTLNMTSCKVATSGAGAPGMESTAFGPKTKAAVQCFQAANGLTADGVVGPMTGAALAAVTGGSTPTTPAPCPVGYVCTPQGGNNNGGSNSGNLSGGAGTLDFSSTSTDVEDTLKEGDDDVKVLGFKAEADGSDIAVTNLKVVFKNDGYASSSERLDRYVDEVTVWHGDTQVGSADVDEFSRDSKSGADEYSKTIQLSNAVVQDGDEDTFWVAVTAKSTIDTDDLDADWNVDADTARYTDATGAILSDDVDENTNFDFEDASADDDINVKSSSADPDAMTFEAKEDNKSDSFLVGAFKLDVDEDSSDITINELPIKFTVASGGSDLLTADDLIDEATVDIDGDSFDLDLDTDNIGTGSGTATYLADLDDDGFTIDSGDDVEVKIYVTFSKQEDNFASGTTIFAQSNVSGAVIDAENADNGDDVSVDGSFTGDTHTVSVDAPTFDLTNSPKLELSQAIDGTSSGEEDVFQAVFEFTVNAPEDTDIYLSSDGGDIGIDQLGGGAASATIDSDTVDESGGSFLINAGDSEDFTVTVTVRGNNENEKITLDEFLYGLDEGDTDHSVSTGLTDFKTPTKYLAK